MISVLADSIGAWLIPVFGVFAAIGVVAVIVEVGIRRRRQGVAKSAIRSGKRGWN